jgi:hypothetical protein
VPIVPETEGRMEAVEELKRDWDALLEPYGAIVPAGLDAFGPEDRRWTYNCICLNVFADSDGSLSATWALTKYGSVILQNARQDEATRISGSARSS